MTPVIIWSFGAGVWFATTLTYIRSKRAGATVFAALMVTLYLVIAVAVAP